jgi:type IV pilus secretin PilQ/predicted competence protein
MKRMKPCFAVILLAVFLLLLSGLASCQLPKDVMVSMDFKDAELKDVLKIFSQQSGLNFISSEGVENKKITLYLDKVSVEDALNTILKANSLSYEQPEGSNIIMIKEIVTAEVETLTRVYQLNYAKAESVKDLFEKMRDKSASADTKTANAETGEKSTMKTAGLLTQYGKAVADIRTNSLIITDIPSQFPAIEETLAKLDEATPQVMIEAEILETTVNNIDKLGVEWGDTIAVFTGPKQTTKFPFTKHDFPAGVDKTTGMAYGTISMASFTASLRMLETDKGTKILARPRVLTLNNETAQINLTAKTAVASITTIQGVAGTTGVQTTSAERMETGVFLRVTPQVNKDDYVTMVLEPSVTTPVKSTYFTGAEYVDPHTRSVKTTVRIKDGDTLVIGGLINTEDTETIKKIPILGDIPLLGYLFKNTSKDKTDKELIIFITPHIFKDYIMPLQGEGAERESTTPAELSKDKVIEEVLDKFDGK